jgi:hypothetical protein
MILLCQQAAPSHQARGWFQVPDLANWTTFTGWLHTALREYPEADAEFAIAEEMSDELGRRHPCGYRDQRGTIKQHGSPWSDGDVVIASGTRGFAVSRGNTPHSDRTVTPELAQDHGFRFVPSR